MLSVLGLLLPYGIGPACLLLSAPAKAQVAVNLKDADLKAFVEIVSEATGRRFVLDPEVRGTVTVLAPDEMSVAELYEVFLAVLELNRLTLIEGTGADRIVSMGSARELASGPSARSGIGDYQSRVIRLRNVAPEELIEVVRPLLPAEAVMTAVPGASMLILSDRGQKFLRIEALFTRGSEWRLGPAFRTV